MSARGSSSPGSAQGPDTVTVPTSSQQSPSGAVTARNDPVRRRIVDASVSLLASEGHLSAPEVADAAGVPLGEVLARFATRTDLLLAVHARVQHTLTAVAPAGSGTLRDASQPERWREFARAGLLACLIEPEVAARQARIMERGGSADEGAGVNPVLIQLATDGLWLADVLRPHGADPAQRAALAAALREPRAADPSGRT